MEARPRTVGAEVCEDLNVQKRPPFKDMKQKQNSLDLNISAATGIIMLQRSRRLLCCYCQGEAAAFTKIHTKRGREGSHEKKETKPGERWR